MNRAELYAARAKRAQRAVPPPVEPTAPATPTTIGCWSSDGLRVEARLRAGMVEVEIAPVIANDPRFTGVNWPIVGRCPLEGGVQ